MIGKIGPRLISVNGAKVQSLNSNKSAQAHPVSFEGEKVGAANLVNSYQAALGIKTAKTVNFNGLTPYEETTVRKNEIVIPNLLNDENEVNMPANKMEGAAKDLNTAGLFVKRSENETHKKVEVTNDMGNKIFVASVKKGIEMPNVTYRQGKFMPEVTVEDVSLKGGAIKMFSGSELKGDGYSLKMPGRYYPVIGGAPKEISFGGKVVLTTLTNEPRTVSAVDMYKELNPKEHIEDGKYKATVVENQPTVVIPAGGCGTRFYNITGENENKPSAKMPTDDRFRLIGTALNLAMAAGILGSENGDNIHYVSQNNQIQGENVTNVDAYKTDGGAIAHAIRENIIPNDKDVMILNADIFTNADVTIPYHALKTLPNAGLVIPYYNAIPEDAKRLGLLGVVGECDEFGNMQIDKFFEKRDTAVPVSTEYATDADYNDALKEYNEIQIARNPIEKDFYMTNPGFYFLSPEAAGVLVNMLNENPEQTGLGKNVMPKILEMMKSGELKDKDGEPMKAYTMQLQTKEQQPAIWYDLGLADAYLDLIKDVANEYREFGNTPENKYHGIPEFLMKDFEKAADSETGIVYMSSDAKDNAKEFSEKFNVNSMKGNILVTD